MVEYKESVHIGEFLTGSQQQMQQTMNNNMIQSNYASPTGPWCKSKQSLRVGVQIVDQDKCGQEGYWDEKIIDQELRVMCGFDQSTLSFCTKGKLVQHSAPQYSPSMMLI